VIFETDKEVLDWYDKQPRALTKEFISSIPWEDVPRYPLNPKFVPVMLYMRDIEIFTEVYHNELKRTPTGKDPVISRFMERWGVEEITHGEVLNRFLNEAGYPTSDNWMEEAKKTIPFSYTAESYISMTLMNFVGRSFTGAHMTWGAINEMTAQQAYRRLWMLAEHPVLEKILRAIVREESAHTQFYWSIARLELKRSEFAQKLARFIIKKFWSPVGQGTKPAKDANLMITTLFNGEEGFSFIDKFVTQRLQQLPGFNNVNTVSERVASIALENAQAT
jgi:hypothetical protein